VDSGGIGAFVSVWASARKSRCELKFINLNDDIHDLVELS
jgi:ABC-type transporter Mla MlaB component